MTNPILSKQIREKAFKLRVDSKISRVAMAEYFNCNPSSIWRLETQEDYRPFYACELIQWCDICATDIKKFMDGVI